MACGESFCPRVNGEYLRKRFAEAILESEAGIHLGLLPEAIADRMVSALVERLITECGAE